MEFKLSEHFLNKYKRKKPPFGFNGLGELVYYRTYSRIKDDGKNERWWETIKRVVEGTYNIQKEWIESHRLEWNPQKSQYSAQEMYDRMFDMKILPPGRGLFAQGSDIIKKKRLTPALFNCCFVSTENMSKDPSYPFMFAKDMLMLGVGMGVDVKGAGTVEVKEPSDVSENFQIPDSREGWVDSLGLLIGAYFGKNKTPNFDYSIIRPAGSPIKTFGGTASGSGPLKEFHKSITKVLDKNVGSLLTQTTIADIFNLIGKVVVAGNTRRSAILIAGDASDEFLDLKNYEKNPERAKYGWSSNNSVNAELGMDYSDIAERIRVNGEPGLLWLENAHKNKRMGDSSNGLQADDRTQATNPCLVGDTLVAVADGRKSVSIKELAEKGDDVPVYCLDSKGSTSIRYMRHPRLTGRDEAIYKVTLDDGNSIRATANHKLRLKTGEHKEVQDLEHGDSLHIMSKFNASIKDIFPKANSNSQDYVWVNNGLKTSLSEHRLIAGFSNNSKIPKGCVVHHRDYVSTNNHPDNLVVMSKKDHDILHSADMLGDKNPMRRAKHERSEEKWKNYKSNMSIATSGKKNGKYSGFSNQELKDHALILTGNLQARFSTSAWLDYAEKAGLPQHFSNWRKKHLGGILGLAKWAALELGFDKFVDQDPRSVKAYKKYTSQGYNCTFINGKVKIIKECEDCSKELVIHCGDREQSRCQKCSTESLNKDYADKRHANQKVAFLRMKEAMQEKQAKAFVDLKFSTGTPPTKKEWIEYCKSIDLSFEMSRKGSPFRYWKDLKEYASTYNHKVVSVELDGYEDVYNGTVDEFHNFFIGDFETQTDFGKAKSLFLNNLQCGEIFLESAEKCNLCEVFPDKHESKEDFIKSLKYAYLYSKTITLLNTHWPQTNAVMLRNRRVGTSVSGIAQFLANRSLPLLKSWLNDGYEALKEYDRVYSNWMAIPRSIRITTNKPSGSISLLNGSTPGIHYPESRFYIRRLRIGNHSDLVKPLQKAGYIVEPAVGQEDSTLVVEIPVDVGEGIRPLHDVSMWEQLEMAAFMSEHWADNAVSVTVTFDPKTEGSDIERAINYFQYKLKSVSFLPRTKQGAYSQMPYEAIDEETYKNMLSKLKKLNLGSIKDEEATVERFCNTDTCSIDQ